MASTASRAGAPARGLHRDVIVLVVIKVTVYRQAHPLSEEDLKKAPWTVETYDAMQP